MSQLRLYMDEDAMRRALVFGLRARNVDVLTALDAMMVNREDEEHLRLAVEMGRALYTYNTADYCILHQRWLVEGCLHTWNHRGATAALFNRRRTPPPRATGGHDPGRSDDQPNRVPLVLALTPIRSRT